MTPESEPPLDLLAVMAHPDDAELLCGGSLAKASAAGRRVAILDLSAGELGSSGTPETRNREAARAAEILGVAERHCAGLPDACIRNTEASRSVVVGYLRRLKPRVVVTHWTVGRHPDHESAASIVRDACYLSGLGNYLTDRLGQRRPPPRAAYRPYKLVYATAFSEAAEPPDFVVDVSRHLDRRMAAMEAYESQFAGARGLGEVFPGGERPIAEQVLAKLAHYGSLIRVPYGEPFRTREALEATDLASLKVSTF